MRTLALIALVAAASFVWNADAANYLDRIAADGVTEVGGSSRYARMLTVTKANGLLDASLLPPVADWASQPISNLYYISGNAAVQGNGSPQYPFRDLTYAMSRIAPQSAVLVAPATYSGTMSIAAGTTTTLVGFRPGSYVSSLTVSAAGSSPSTCLALVGMRIGYLYVSGGVLNIRLSCSTIERLDGSSTGVRVVREDMGSFVGACLVHAEDSYAGYGTTPRAETIVDPSSSWWLAVTGDRAKTSNGAQTNVVAYVSDVVAATNSIAGKIGAVETTYDSLSERIGSEEHGRSLADTALSNRINAAVSDMQSRIAAVGTAWNEQLAILSESLSGVSVAVNSLSTRETDDIASVRSSIAGVSSAYAAADASIRADLAGLSSSLSALDAGLDARIWQVSTNAANGIIDSRASTIRTDAINISSNYTRSVKASLTADIQSRYGELASRIATNRAEIIQTVAVLNALINSLSNASDTASEKLTTKYRMTLPAPVPSL